MGWSEGRGFVGRPLRLSGFKLVKSTRASRRFLASRRCRLQRVAVVSTLRVYVGALAQQQLDDLVLASRRCYLQRVAVVSYPADQSLRFLKILLTLNFANGVWRFRFWLHQDSFRENPGIMSRTDHASGARKMLFVQT